MIEFWITLKGDGRPFIEASLPVTKRIHRHVVIAFALQDHYGSLDFLSSVRREVAAQIEPIAWRSEEQSPLAVGIVGRELFDARRLLFVTLNLSFLLRRDLSTQTVDVFILS